MPGGDSGYMGLCTPCEPRTAHFKKSVFTVIGMSFYAVMSVLKASRKEETGGTLCE